MREVLYLKLKNIRVPKYSKGESSVIKMPSKFTKPLTEVGKLGGNPYHTFGTSIDLQRHYCVPHFAIQILFKEIHPDMQISKYKRLDQDIKDMDMTVQDGQGYHKDAPVEAMVVDGRTIAARQLGFSMFIGNDTNCCVHVGGEPNYVTGKVNNAELVTYGKGEVIIIRCDTLHKAAKKTDIKWTRGQKTNHRGFMAAYYVEPSPSDQIWWDEEKKVFCNYFTRSKSSPPDYNIN